MSAVDAITKLKKLSMIGEYEAPDDIEYKVEIKLSAKDKTIKIIDNGIGMTADELEMEEGFRRFALYQDKALRDTWRSAFRKNHLRQITAQNYGAGVFVQHTAGRTL